MPDEGGPQPITKSKCEAYTNNFKRVQQIRIRLLPEYWTMFRKSRRPNPPVLGDTDSSPDPRKSFMYLTNCSSWQFAFCRGERAGHKLQDVYRILSADGVVPQILVPRVMQPVAMVNSVLVDGFALDTECRSTQSKRFAPQPTPSSEEVSTGRVCMRIRKNNAI